MEAVAATLRDGGRLDGLWTRLDAQDPPGSACRADLAAAVAAADSGDASAAAAAAVRIQAAAWAQLHAPGVHWRDVDSAWRDGYAAAGLLAAAAAHAGAPLPPHTGTDVPGGVSGGVTAPLTPKSAALRQLDLALFLGGPLFRLDIQDAIEAAQQACGGAKRPRPSPQTWAVPRGPGRPLPHASLADSSRAVPVRRAPSLESFFTDWMGPGKPVLLRGVTDGWPAATKWKDPGYLRRVAGGRTVPIEVGRHYASAGWTQRLETLASFLDAHMPAESVIPESVIPESTAYLAQHPLLEQVAALRDDVIIPDYTCLGQGDVRAVMAWLGPRGTTTPLHTDPHHNILAQVVGSKYVRLYDPCCGPALRPHPPGSMMENTATVDLDEASIGIGKSTESLEFQDCVLAEGDGLYIPPGWWHYVRSLEPSFSVSFWWS